MPIKIIMIGIEVPKFLSLYICIFEQLTSYEEPRIKFSNISNLN